MRSRKLAQISHSGTAVLMYLDPRKNAGVAVHTRAVISTDAAVRQASFPVAFRAFWPDGPDDPDFAVAACTPVAVEVWDPSRRITPPPFGLIGARIERAEAGWTLVDSWRAGTDR